MGSPLYLAMAVLFSTQLVGINLTLEQQLVIMFALMGSKGGLHSTSGHKITVWGTDADATRWYITANELDDAIEACAALEELIVKTQDLTQEMADAQLVTKLALQTQSSSQANYLSTNACHNTLNNESDGQGLAGLLDESTSTYFHSDYKDKVTAAHYLLVDLGKGSSVAKFTFNYTTRANGDNCPTEIKVEGGSNKFKYVVLKTFTAANDGLPNGNALSWLLQFAEKPFHRACNRGAWRKKKCTFRKRQPAFYNICRCKCIFRIIDK